jgi:hypothetical protein
MDCYGVFGEGAATFVNKCLRLIQAQEEAPQRRQAEANLWQTLSIIVAREIARQVAWGAAAETDFEGNPPPLTHNPYSALIAHP